jgi:hypothetical protein
MRKKLTSLFNYAAGVSLPLISAAAFGHRLKPPAFHPQPPPEPVAQPDLPAALAQMTQDAAPNGGTLKALALSLLAGADWKMRALHLLAGVVLGGLIGVRHRRWCRRCSRILAAPATAVRL